MTVPDIPAEEPIFSALLTPHRSLSQTGFMLVMMALVACSFTAGLAFWLMGAWPVVGFFGLDVLGLWLAFRWSYRTARAQEEVVVTPVELLVRKISHWGDAAEWRFNPIWVRLLREQDPEFGLSRVAVVERGRSLDVGGFLGPREKARFADDFGAALLQARRGPNFG